MSQTIRSLTYEKDYYQWTIEQAQALRKLVSTHQELKQLDNLDWDNIIEEIEALGRSEYSAVVSLLRRQIEHRLKIDYVPLEECYRKWTSEALAFKKNLKGKYAPSMKPKLEKQFSEIYQDAVEIVEAEYDVNLPDQCPYNLVDLIF